MDRSVDKPSLNSTQSPYSVGNEADMRTNVSPSQQMPLIRFPTGSPVFSPGQRSAMFHPSPAFYPFSTSTPSSSSLFPGSSSAPVEDRDSSIWFNNNQSLPQMMSPPIGLKNNPPLPPMIPSTTYNPMRVSSIIVPPRKAHKRSISDTIGFNSMIPLNFPELNNPKPSEPLIGESSRGKEGVCEMKSDEEFDKNFNFDAFMNLDFNAFNLNENKDEIFIDRNDLKDDKSAVDSGSKSGSSSSVGKRRASQEYGLSSKHYRSVSLDSCFNDLLKKPPLPPANVMGKVSSTNSVNGNDIVGSSSKRDRRMLANRQAAARFREKKDQHIAYLEHKAMTLEKEIKKSSGQLPFFKTLKTALLTKNEELKIRIESMNQQENIGEAMNIQLNAEVKRLKAAIALNQQLNVQVQRPSVATTVNEQLSAEVQQLNSITGEVMQNPNDFEMTNVQTMNAKMLPQVNFNQYNQRYPPF